MKKALLHSFSVLCKDILIKVTQTGRKMFRAAGVKKSAIPAHIFLTSLRSATFHAT